MKKIILVLLAIFQINIIFAQNFASSHFGFTLPQGDFASYESPSRTSGGVNYGFSGGLKYHFAINKKGLNLFVGSDFFFNALKKSTKDDFDKQNGWTGLQSVKYLRYFNIPITTGLSYKLKVVKNFACYGEFGLGADVLKVTKMTASLQTTDIEYSYNYSVKFCYRLGLGIILLEDYSLGVEYNNFGTHTIEETITGAVTEKRTSNDLNISTISICIGFKL